MNVTSLHELNSLYRNLTPYIMSIIKAIKTYKYKFWTLLGLTILFELLDTYVSNIFVYPAVIFFILFVLYGWRISIYSVIRNIYKDLKDGIVSDKKQRTLHWSIIALYCLFSAVYFTGLGFLMYYVFL